jgi:hypothetical protein
MCPEFTHLFPQLEQVEISRIYDDDDSDDKKKKSKSRLLNQSRE